MIKVKNLTHYYNNDKALENINLEINDSTCTILKGVSGSGKSTLLSLIATMDKPTSGYITVDILG